MEANLGIIKLKPGTRELTEKYLKYFLEETDDLFFEMNQKRYFWDSVFHRSVQNEMYLYVVTKSRNFDETKGTSEIKTTKTREIYNQFIEECWDQEENFVLENIKAPYCLNETYTAKDYTL